MTTAAAKTNRAINILVAGVIAIGAGMVAAPASAENFNPRAFLFGSAVKMQEGRSASIAAASHRTLNQSTIAQPSQQSAELRGTIVADTTQRIGKVKLASALRPTGLAVQNDQLPGVLLNRSAISGQLTMSFQLMNAIETAEMPVI